jgi:succinate dehydrogenase/fumarate reductase flavoprotein subunit
MERRTTDVLIVGAGAAGLFAALHLPDHLAAALVTLIGHDRGQVIGQV